MPKVYLKEVLFQGKTFCCCLPVRVGVICMSFLGICFGGLLSFICWFQVANAPELTSNERTAFILAGLVETLLLLASTLGFLGAVVRKQLFVQIYAYFTYVHFFVNVVVAAYLLYVVTHFSDTALEHACQGTIQNTQGQDQCSGLLKFARGLYVAVAGLVLLTEMYGALIVARYLNQIQSEKRAARDSYRLSSYAFSMSNQTHYSNLDDQPFDNQFPRSSPPPKWNDTVRDFDPYEENGDGPSYNTGYTGYKYDSVPVVEETRYNAQK
ncbi:hypothetical protein K435DRAFT_123839 [Dendrothele bispora CBS 962.96]|uniref:Uncharacterized protein n=1 Tax=Dendrothele bispora (strain CBS 962.96) TaxID=1314807 RepID=A0A4S8M0U6_DENBC|nr:hypothetical protein K435DRAFT_123839 [Dendrothele bispora CBS 962.96]